MLEGFTRTQIERFRAATAGLAGITHHIANSAATLRYPEAAFDGWGANEDVGVGCIAPREIASGSAGQMIHISRKIPFAARGAFRIVHVQRWF